MPYTYDYPRPALAVDCVVFGLDEAVYAWLRHYGDFRATLEAALDCGGDTDTVGAIAGALAGATTGAAAIPEPWLRGIIDWPRSLKEKEMILRIRFPRRKRLG